MEDETNSLLCDGIHQITKGESKSTEIELKKEKKEKKGKKEKKEKKEKKKRCYECNTRLKMISYTCKCGHIFCHKHLNPHSHNCTFDYMTEKKKQIEKNNPKLASKFDKI